MSNFNNSNKTIIRIEKNKNFSVISNIHLNDKNLSWKAKGLLTFLLSKPDNWQISIKNLMKASTDRYEATMSGLNELIEFGYITRQQLKDESGKFSKIEYIVIESPNYKQVNNNIVLENVPKSGFPITGFPLTGFPLTGNPNLLNTEVNNIYINNYSNDHDNSASTKKNFENEKSSSLLNNNFFKELVDKIRTKEQKQESTQNIIKEALEKKLSPEYISSCIEYANQNSTKNYNAFLRKTLNSPNWSLELEEKKEQQFEDEKQKAILQQQLEDAKEKAKNDELLRSQKRKEKVENNRKLFFQDTDKHDIYLKDFLGNLDIIGQKRYNKIKNSSELSDLEIIKSNEVLSALFDIYLEDTYGKN
ncbi:MAG: hypothetical protein HQK77_12190 [Desulfobacterales bacterium]|nr:hypothetical protein [Desulfobacterales bacterium]